MAGRSSTQAYRGTELGDVADAIDRMTLGVAKAEDAEPVAVAGFRQLLVAVDGSPSSRNALAWAAELAKRFGARITVVSVGPSPQTAQALRAGSAWAAVQPAFDESDELARETLAKAGAYLRERGLEASLELKQGRTAQAIVGLAISEQADLVILGSHGHGLGERLNLGSIGSAVKHHVPCSVLIARGPPNLRRILLATDGSQRSRLAVAVGLELAKAFRAKPTLAHVIDVTAYGLARSKAVKRGKLLAVQERMRESPGLAGLDTHVEFGPPAKRLRKLATDSKADLIVLGSRGLGGLKGLALGSVSDALTHKAAQSVLAIKPKAT